MKKTTLLILSAAMMMVIGCAPASSGTDTSSDPGNTTMTSTLSWKVTFHIFEDETKVVDVVNNHTVDNYIPEPREGYNFVGWYTNEEYVLAYDFNNKVTADLDLYAKWLEEGEKITTQVLKDALNQDYTNSTVWQYQSGVGDEFIVNNIDGYSVTQTALDGIGQRDFLFFHDYQGESHQYWYEDALGGAWIRKGIKFSDGSYATYDVDLIYWTPMYSFPIIEKHADLFTYAGGGAFNLTDEAGIKALLDDGLFVNVWDNDIAQVIVYLNEAKTMVKEIRTYDSLDPNDPNYTRTQLFDVGNTTLIDVDLPEPPNENNVKTYYEWKGEEEPIYTEIESITLGFADETITSVNLDKELELKYELNPTNPGRKDLEFIIDGIEDGIKVSYSFTPNQLVVHGNIAGTYKIKIHDKITDVYSNEVTVVVNDTAESKFTNALYDLFFEDNGVYYEIKNNIDNGKKATYITSDQEVEVNACMYGDNPKLDMLTNAVIFGVNKTVNTGPLTLDLSLDSEVNALSFTYGVLFENQVSNARSENMFVAKILTSNDGVNYDNAIDWTNDFIDNVHAKGLSRQDIELGINTRYVRIQFESKFIGKGFDLAINSFGLYLE